MKCPKCGNAAKQSETRYGIRNHCCDLWSWGDGAQLADSETHDARKAAHAAFDPCWQSGHMSRAAAYKWLSEKLGIPRKQCHMKLMDKMTALRVAQIAPNLLDVTI